MDEIDFEDVSVLAIKHTFSKLKVILKMSEIRNNCLQILPQLRIKWARNSEAVLVEKKLKTVGVETEVL